MEQLGQLLFFDDPLNYRQVIRRIRRLLEDGYFEVRGHAQQQMRKRKLDLLDIQHIIRYGSIEEHSKPDRLWRYKIVGTSVERRKAACVVEVNGRIIVVTVMGLK